ncbi:MAG: hypothetical protein ACE5J4_03535, partial [Candidatus Aenigmatarchaeota archaeon]
LVRRKKKISLSKAASALRVDRGQVEQWVRVLEDRGYLKLMYPPIGEPYIIPGELPITTAVKRIKGFERRKGKVKEKVAEFEKKVGEVEEKIQITDEKFLGLEDELQIRLREVERDLEKLDEFERKKKEIMRTGERIRQFTEVTAKHFNKVRASLRALDKRIKEQLKDLEKHGVEMKDLDRARKRIEIEIEALDKEIKIVKDLVKEPVRIPIIGGLKKTFRSHKRRAIKIERKRKKIHKKVEKIKKAVRRKHKKAKKKRDHARRIILKYTKKRRKRRVKKKVKRKKRRVKRVRKKKTKRKGKIRKKKYKRKIRKKRPKRKETTITIEEVIGAPH